MQNLEDETDTLEHQLNQPQKWNVDIQQDLNHKEHSKQNEELCEARNDLSYSLNQNTNNNHFEDDILKEREAEDRNLKQIISKLEQLSNSSQAVLAFKMKYEKLVSAYEDVRLMLEKEIVWNHQDSLGKSTIVGLFQMKKAQWETNLREAEKGLSEVVKISEQTIQELSCNCNLDSFPLWQEQEGLIRIIREKDLEIAELKKNMERIEANQKTTKAILSSHLEEWQQLVPLIKDISTSLKDKETLKEELEQREGQSPVAPVVEPKIPDTMTELQSEIHQLNISKDNNLEEDINPHPKITEDQSQKIMQLLPPLREQEEEMDDLTYQCEQMNMANIQFILASNKEIKNLRKTPEQVKTYSPKENQDIQTENSVNLENGSEDDFSQTKPERLIKKLEIEELTGQTTADMDQLSKDEIDRPTEMIEQKYLETQDLYSKISSISHRQDVGDLQQQQAYGLVREQQVLAEKTRENNNLQGDYHKMMAISIAKEADNLRIPDEDNKLSPGLESHFQDLDEEAVSNLLDIDEEKDMEIDALSQKCQASLTLFQISSTGNKVVGVDSNQLEALLQEHHQLKQQVRILKEWKQQVMILVKNMHSDSAHREEKLLQLQMQILAYRDNNSKLLMNYVDLLQYCKGDEMKFKSMEQELTQIQLAIGQLCNVKDLLLVKIDLLMTQPLTESPLIEESEDCLMASPAAALNKSSKLLQEEVEDLRKLMQEKDATIRMLQVEHQKLSDSIAAASELERKQHEQTNSEMKQLKEKQDVLQNLLQEKELLIKAKSNELLSVRENLISQVDENEILRQAVINLKERVLHFEIESCKLKQENEKIIETSQEKAGEMQALQETNVKLSQLLKEQELKYLPVKKVLEQLSNEEEQGKTRKLNQLLNTITLMQEKTVLFQQERNELTVALKNKQMDIEALQNEIRYLCNKELHLKQELENTQKQVVELQNSLFCKARDADDKELNLRMKIMELKGKLSSSCTATESASHQAKILQDQLNIVNKQKDETAAQLSAWQEQENRALADTKVALAESMEKTVHLEEKAASLQGQLDRANAAVELTVGQIEDLKKQNDVLQEMLDAVQKKWMDLVTISERNIDKSLMRKLFLDYFQTQKDERQQVLQLIGSTLDIKKEEMESLMREDPVGIKRWMTEQPGSQNDPNPPRKPNESSTQKNSFSELFVHFLKAETSEPLAAPKRPAHGDKTPQAAGKKTVKKGPPSLKTAVGSTPKETDGLAIVSLVSPPGHEAGGSGNLLHNVANAFPIYTHLLVSPSKNTPAALKDFAKQ
ncbi:thyroid receptor-interacting protein 11-like [Talpa occidentalis]|uniref:thyroid receptor-interacting protein 11-like n=1 Tax=Talpa occidentalis TaxID=50954 RepID=UPI0023F95729|nr:thyroid receptor-interacting protein 11-like [Talpa occidentalis]